MDVTRVCSPLLAGSDSQNNTISAPNAASVTDADKVIKTKIASTQVEGAQSEDAFLNGLLADDYCHICEAVLLFESQRLSHYEGKKHAQKLKVYLQTKRAERTNTQSTGLQTVITNRDRFCELCNMMFSSQVVAKSHYEGKVHTKNLRKQGLHPPVTDRNKEVCTSLNGTPNPDKADQKHVPEGCMGHHVDPAASSTALSTEGDLKDPKKYCALCAAFFNNPHMASQHYNGRKHQRNQARQELMKELGDDVQQGSPLMCQMCSLQFNSVEMYKAHMHGNKHQVREKKVVDLCKSQHKAYSTFADELADYIQVQKARGITPKANQASLQGDEADEEEEQTFDTGDVTKLHKPLANLPSKSQSHYQSWPGSYYSVKVWGSRYQGPSWPSQHSATNFPPSALLESGSPQFPGRTIQRKRQRKQSSSSSYTNSSSYSSYSSSYTSSTSDTEDSEDRHRGRRKLKRSRKDGCRRKRDEVQRRNKQHRKEGETQETRREECGELDHETKRKRLKHHSKQAEEMESREEDCEVERSENAMENLEPKELNDGKQTEEHIQTEMHVELEDDGQNESAKSKSRKEKKKMKGVKADTRTEEERLWDDSILGC
ncbi:zinc finger matrin-type protein 1 isoform X2 [Betta splendens]|uniref:Zinc finger matrin-type protein 1 isoform X2 n=1 Tax=Betta splendens TaxID=158456 RepID=A0A9W2XSK1_BETSP|nr:zinc finger matrin-type protein 1 isoform X2 [Betta splendens]